MADAIATDGAPGSRASRAGLVGALLLVAALVGAYLSAGLEGPFLFDDRTAIVENRSLEPGAGWRALLWPDPDISSSGRPLVNLSFALDRRLFGLDAAAFRRTNLLLFALLAVLVLAFLRRTFASPALAADVRERALPLAFAASLLWALHPLLSELVLYPTQRTEILAAVGVLGALVSAIRAADAPRSAGRWTAVAALCALLGVLSKESAVVAPLLVLAWDLVFLEGDPRAILRRRRALHLALLASWIPLAALVAAGPRAGSVGFHLEHDYLDWIRSQCVALVGYAAKAVWPHPLILDHGPLRATPWSAAWPGALLAAALVAAALVSLSRRRPAGFALAGALLTLAPSSSLVPIVTEVAAERRMTLASIALVAAAVLVCHRVLARLGRTGLVGLGGSLLAVVLALEVVALHARAAEFRTLEGLWRTVVERVPANPRAHYNLGLELAAQGRLEEAIERYRASLALDPAKAAVQDSLAVALAMSGRPAEALPHAREAARLAPGDPRPRSNLGLCLLALGRLEAALQRFDEALALDPGFADARQNRALALDALGRGEEAEAELRRALALAPEHDAARFNLARRLAGEGREREALELLAPLVGRDAPDEGAVGLAFGLYLRGGRGDEGLALVRAAGLALAGAGRGEAARELARSAARTAREAGEDRLADELGRLAAGL